MRQTGHLLTEKINHRTTNIDELSTSEIVELINSEDNYVIKAVSDQKSNIVKAVELVYESLKNNARLIFIGAGTSGRLGVIEAAECPPTFGTDPEIIEAIIAGGKDAVWQSIEGSEDSEKDSKNELKSKKLTSSDTIVGIAASSSTPFVISALEYAKSIGCSTILITCNSLENYIADVSIELLVGPEVIVGSTRLKSGTATKMVLNIITTTVMVKLGKTFGNLMVDVQPKSSKLRDRALRIVMSICDIERKDAFDLLTKSGWDVKIAIIMKKKNLNKSGAENLLIESHGFLKKALK
ncbi:MAG: N-acetylmuramic acid 6-phosphate etherase [Candidatus Dadabacteria bacterium]|nr:N-acetylmuramic acid 6-phosphate etherase [Candidatus Dadabacteria bacterium]NIQ14937.1 N-acetylmuramic acid 6-phosphate etherase [Candidatus Dadabacteria bacterium]